MRRSNLLEYYASCIGCSDKGEKFQDMYNHFTGVHNSLGLVPNPSGDVKCLGQGSLEAEFCFLRRVVEGIAPEVDVDA